MRQQPLVGVAPVSTDVEPKKANVPAAGRVTSPPQTRSALTEHVAAVLSQEKYSPPSPHPRCAVSVREKTPLLPTSSVVQVASLSATAEM